MTGVQTCALPIFARYPQTLEVNKLQVNLGNVVARMTNAMNAPLLDALEDEYKVLKDGYRRLTEDFGTLQYRYFLQVLDSIENEASDVSLSAMSDDFFGTTYSLYLPRYQELYESFIQKVIDKGFGLSGLVFKHFLSTMATKKVERIS